jgi:hypothetical protein
MRMFSLVYNLNNLGVPITLHKCKHVPEIEFFLENCVLLGYYTASSGNSLSTFQDNLLVPTSMVHHLLGFLTLEDGTESLS